MNSELLIQAAKLIRKARYAVAFTGAGISVASGIPPFRGENGLWNTTDPIFLDIEFFNRKPLQSWLKIKEIFYDKLRNVEPNIAHEVLAKMEERSFLESVITQNIDHLHQKAGNHKVFELHGTYKHLVCTKCMSEYDMSFADLNYLPPTCLVCRGILKPDIVFFNEPIPAYAERHSFEEAAKADVMLIIGTHRTLALYTYRYRYLSGDDRLRSNDRNWRVVVFVKEETKTLVVRFKYQVSRLKRQVGKKYSTLNIILGSFTF